MGPMTTRLDVCGVSVNAALKVAPSRSEHHPVRPGQASHLAAKLVTVSRGWDGVYVCHSHSSPVCLTSDQIVNVFSPM